MERACFVSVTGSKHARTLHRPAVMLPPGRRGCNCPDKPKTHEASDLPRNRIGIRRHGHCKLFVSLYRNHHYPESLVHAQSPFCSGAGAIRPVTSKSPSRLLSLPLRGSSLRPFPVRVVGRWAGSNVPRVLCCPSSTASHFLCRDDTPLPFGVKAVHFLLGGANLRSF
jgi:hypothetical protein